MLKEDIFKIYKSWTNQNACEGKYPNVKWYCNNLGDGVSNPSHICVCDSPCNINIEEIQK